MSLDLIPLHARDLGCEILVNIHCVVYIIPYSIGGGAAIVLTTGTVYVTEGKEELAQLLGYVHPTWKAVMETAR